MFDINNFVYNEKEHAGYYNGVRVPSVTQLLELLFPLSENIPIDRVEKAAKKGTMIHEQLHQANIKIKEHHIAPSGCLNNLQEVNDYLGLLEAYHLRPFEYERMVFLLDEHGDLITFGTFDLIVYTSVNQEPFKKGKAYMCDFKTTSIFDKEKTAYQTAIYRVAFKQYHGLYCDKQTFGIHLRNGIKLIPLKSFEDDYIINLCKTLFKAWKERELNAQ